MLTPSPNGARWPEPQPLANPGRFMASHSRPRQSRPTLDQPAQVTKTAGVSSEHNRKPDHDEETTDEQTARRGTAGRDTDHQGDDPQDPAHRPAHRGTRGHRGHRCARSADRTARPRGRRRGDLRAGRELTAETGDEVAVAAAGSYVLKPYGVMHAFWNATNEPARV